MQLEQLIMVGVAATLLVCGALVAYLERRNDVALYLLGAAVVVLLTASERTT